MNTGLPIDRASGLACWRSAVDPEPLEGGITNTNFTVIDGGEKFVVRIGHDLPIHQISRANELASAKAAHAAGISPEVVHWEPGALVIRWVEGHTLTEQEVRQQANLERIVPLLKRCHQQIPLYFRGPAPMLWVFQVVRDYGQTLGESTSRHHADLVRYLELSAQLERVIGPIDVVFGHNDLLAANIIDDGEQLWLIDWEYAGFNSPLFDLGGLASNNELTAEQESWLLECYFEGVPTDGLKAQYAAMKCASLLRESLWSMVQEVHSTLDVDYAAYTDENLSRFRRALAALGMG